jgi:hypothetical protein
MNEHQTALRASMVIYQIHITFAMGFGVTEKTLGWKKNKHKDK